MPEELSTESLLAVIKRSDLVNDDVVERVWATLQASGAPNALTPAALAEALIEQSAITRWHAKKLLQGKYRGFAKPKPWRRSIIPTLCGCMTSVR